MQLLEGWRAQISRHKRGFWQGDLFDGDADVPEAFFTMSVDGSRDAAIAKAVEKWPYAEIYVVGPCDCDDGKSEDDETCSACDGEGEVSRPLTV